MYSMAALLARSRPDSLDATTWVHLRFDCDLFGRPISVRLTKSGRVSGVECQLCNKKTFWNAFFACLFVLFGDAQRSVGCGRTRLNTAGRSTTYLVKCRSGPGGVCGPCLLTATRNATNAAQLFSAAQFLKHESFDQW